MCAVHLDREHAILIKPMFVLSGDGRAHVSLRQYLHLHCSGEISAQLEKVTIDGTIGGGSVRALFEVRAMSQPV